MGSNNKTNSVLHNTPSLTYGGKITNEYLAKDTHAKGLSIAWRLSTAIAVSVNTLTVMESTWMNGQKAHMNDGRFHRCSKAA